MSVRLAKCPVCATVYAGERNLVSNNGCPQCGGQLQEGLPDGALSAACLAEHTHAPGDYSTECWAVQPWRPKA